MAKNNKGVKNMIPKKQLNKAEQKNQAMDQIVLDRKAKSQERTKILFKGIMDGIGKAFDEMKEEHGEPTFNEMNDAFFRSAHAYNQRALEEQWKNVQIVDPKEN
jgi:hypothetical protein